MKYLPFFNSITAVKDGDIVVRQLRNGKTLEIAVKSKSDTPYCFNEKQKKELKRLQKRVLAGEYLKMSKWQVKSIQQLYPVKAPKIQGESSSIHGFHIRHNDHILFFSLSRLGKQW